MIIPTLAVIVLQRLIRIEMPPLKKGNWVIVLFQVQDMKSLISK